MAHVVAQFEGATQAFQNQIRNNWAQIAKQKGNPPKTIKEAASLANAVYQNTLNSSLPFVVIGMDRIREKLGLKENLGLITGKAPKKKEVYEPKGAIFGEPHWSTLVNDLFIIGAVHGKKEVHTTLKTLPESDKIWDPDKSTFTPFGREIAILKIAGYEPVIFRSGKYQQLLFRPSCGGIGEDLTYEKVAARLGQIKTLTQSQHLIQEPDSVFSDEGSKS